MLGGELEVRRLGFGAMRIVDDREEGKRVVRRAVELGVTLIDTADIYGAGKSEEIVAEALHPYPEGLVITTKGGLGYGLQDRIRDARPERLRLPVVARPGDVEVDPRHRRELTKEQRELMEKRLTRRIVSTPEKVADAIVAVGPGGKAERYVPRPYWRAPTARIVAPRLVRRVLGAGAAKRLMSSTGPDAGEP